MKLIYSLHKYDVFIFSYLINSRIHRYLAVFCRQLSRSADGHLYLLLAAGLYYLYGLENAFLKSLLLAFAIERPLYFVLKNGFKRNRPAAALENFTSLVTPSDQFSFPSGHTSAAFMVAALTGYFLPELLLPLLFWAALVGLSRVVLGVHFPFDTLMGMVLGCSVALFSLNQFVI